jgi:hypothetical protein
MSSHILLIEREAELRRLDMLRAAEEWRRAQQAAGSYRRYGQGLRTPVSPVAVRLRAWLASRIEPEKPRAPAPQAG